MNSVKRFISMAFPGVLFFIVLNMVLSCSGNKINPLVGPNDDGGTLPPAKPSQPALTSVGNGEIQISWLPNSEEDLAGYRLYRAENVDNLADYNVIFDSTETNFRDINLNYTTVYYYRVSAYDSSGNESQLSDPASGIPQNTLPPGTPVNVGIYAQNINNPMFELTWNPNIESDLWGYRIYRSTESEFAADETTLLDSTVNTLYADTDVLTDTVYYYKIRAVDNGRLKSLPTNPDSDVALSPPELLSPVNGLIVSPAPIFSWTPVAKTVQYKIFVQTTRQGGEIWSKTVDNTQISAHYDGTAVLESRKEYFWKVATITKDPDRLNSFSEIQSFRIQ